MKKSRLLIAFIVVCVLLGCGFIGYYFWSTHNKPKDLNGNPIVADEQPSDKDIRDMDIHDTNGRMVIEQVGMDVPLASMRVPNGVINPPGFTKAYVIRNFGVGNVNKAEQGTVFVTMHSVKRGFAPGNYFIDVGKEYSKVKPGFLVEVSGKDYVVKKNMLVRKTKLKNTAEVWEDTPGKLVIITCIQLPRGMGSSAHNLVTFAELKD